MKRLAFQFLLFASALFAAWTSSSSGAEPNAPERKQAPPRFGKVLVLFSADMAKEDRDGFLAGLEDVRLLHQKDCREIVRKERESTPRDAERTNESGGDNSRRESERGFSRKPYFLDVVDVQTVRTEMENPSFDDSPGGKSSRLTDLESLRRLAGGEGERFDALVVAASDEIAAEVNRMIRNNSFEPVRDDMVVLFAGVTAFDDPVRDPQRKDGSAESAKFPYAFAIRRPVDPWPNTELALSAFPKTRKIILLTSGKIWNAEREKAYLFKLGPGKTLKTILIPEIPKRDVTESDIAGMKDKFLSELKAEIAPDTVVVTLSSAGHGLYPASWLPPGFDACPVFTDTNPVQASAVGGFGRSMRKLGIQSAELLEHLGNDSLPANRLPSVVMEEDELRLNTAALRKFNLRESSFPENPVLTDSETGRAVPGEKASRTRRRIVFIHAAAATAILGLFAFALLSARAGRRNRRLSELIYGALPVRVLVTDRDGRIIAYHNQYGEMEQKGEFLWKNIAETPWLQGTGLLKIVHDVFDSGKTVVRELEIDGERRVVVFARTQSDVFGRPAVIAVSSVSPEEKKS